MFVFDRMYGELKFPPLIKKVLDCPGLLRLREVRMANIPFFSFPSFTAVTRFEHSLGVAHLARIFSETIDLADKERHELMLAALYHDVATPPFGHLVEEVLNSKYGYDHERKLCSLIVGNSDEHGGQRAQIFLGKSLKLHKICQSLEGRKLGIDPYRIADLTTGDLDASYGDIIASKGIDLDNIDNVIRAATAMGISDFTPKICETIAKSFVEHNNQIFIQDESRFYTYQWQQARELLYGMIFSSVCDFSLQTMLKDALRVLSMDNSFKLKKEDWALTDEQLIYQRLLKNTESEQIIRRMRLMQLYQPLSLLTLDAAPDFKLDSNSIMLIVSIAESILVSHIEGSKSYLKLVPGKLAVNVYADKRKRYIRKRFLSYGNETDEKYDLNKTNKLILGLFSVNSVDWSDKCTDEFIRQINLQIKDIYSVEKTKIVTGKYPSIN